MNFKYRLFGFLFNFFRLINRNPKDVAFVAGSKVSFKADLKYIKKELDKRGHFNYHYIFREEYSSNEFYQSLNNNQKTQNKDNNSNNQFKQNNLNKLKNKIELLFNLLTFFLVKSYQLSKSKYIFLNDNFFPIAYMNFGRNTIVIQLWHATGAFKKFGLHVLYNEKVREIVKFCGLKIDYLVVSSRNLSKIYCEAFAVDEKQILAGFSPKMDYYFSENIQTEDKIAEIKSKLENNYHEIKNYYKDYKKFILYAPTFREDKEHNKNIPKHFDFSLFNKELANDYCLLFKAHPKFNIQVPKSVVDVSDYDNIQELLLISDILITDYSSIMVEYTALSKPIIFYPYDLEYYTSKERGFYFDYNDVPGPIAVNTQDIINIIKNNDFDFEKIAKFAEYSFDYLDNNSSKRIVDFVLNKF